MKAASLSLAIAALSVTALAPADAKPIKAKYYCNKGQSLKVVFQGSKATVTPKGGKTVTLYQSLAADGFSYSKGRYNLRGKSDWATWTTGRGKPLNCTAH
jgi:membrane-bound inhibitor of C-type lysozyme